MIGDSYIAFDTMYYDRTLLNEANEKGASWLIAQINPEGVNVHNYERYITDDISFAVYEKEVQLGDRSVLGMIIDIGNESIGIYFVYDDILIVVWGNAEFLEAVLPDITFQEVSLPTNRPLRRRPGREGTRFSTRDVQIVSEDIYNHDILESEVIPNDLTTADEYHGDHVAIWDEENPID